jgi:hypothetical protein
MRKLLPVVFVFAMCSSLWADFTYQETTQITGGALLSMMRLGGPFTRGAREPIVSTHMIKGDRMATVTKDRTTIIDLDKENITTIDYGKKTYSVMTFAEMKQMMEDMSRRMQQRRGQKTDDPNVEANFKVSAKTTGQTKTVQGLSAKEMVLTMAIEGSNTKTGESGAMTVVSDGWFAKVAGYDEVKAFHRKMAEKMGYMYGSGMNQMGMMRADVGKGFEEVAKEMAKIDGVPVENVIKMTGTANGAENSSASDQRPQQQQDAGTPTSPAAALGRLAGIGGFGRRKKTEEQPQQAPAEQQQSGSASSGTLIETTTQLTNYSTGPVDGSKFEIPAGFKQVQPEMRRGAQ